MSDDWQIIAESQKYLHIFEKLALEILLVGIVLWNNAVEDYLCINIGKDIKPDSLSMMEMQYLPWFMLSPKE